MFAPYLADEAAARRAGGMQMTSVVDESMVVMSAAGTALMALVAGKEVTGTRGHRTSLLSRTPSDLIWEMTK